MCTVTLYNFLAMAMAAKITRDLSTVTSCIDLSVRIVTKSPKVEPLLLFSISLLLTLLPGYGQNQSKKRAPRSHLSGPRGFLTGGGCCTLGCFTFLLSRFEEEPAYNICRSDVGLPLVQWDPDPTFVPQCGYRPTILRIFVKHWFNDDPDPAFTTKQIQIQNLP
jgi:hypothetical protein